MQNVSKKKSAAKTDNLQLSERIVTDINVGRYGPGEWLKQIDLERRYGVTRLAVRRVLDELVAKRLVQHVPNRGYRVHLRSPEQSREVAEIRTLLEVAAVPTVIAKTTEADVAELYELAQAFKDAAYSGTLLEQNDANLRFHHRLLSLCTNATLADLIMELRQGSPGAPVTRWRTVAQLEKAARDHFLIVEALEKKDAEAMKAHITSHINDKGPDQGIPRDRGDMS